MKNSHFGNDMATRRKTTTVKTGPYSKRTITVSSNGTRITNSNKPPGSPTRRTVSTNLRTGKTRITNTRSDGGGWITSNSKTFGGTKYKPSKSRKNNINLDDYDLDDDMSFMSIIKGLLLMAVVYGGGFILLAIFLGLLLA